MGKLGIRGFMASGVALLALSSCASVDTPREQVHLEVVGPAIEAPQIPLPDFYRLPQPALAGADGGSFAQKWSILGREDRGAASERGRFEYSSLECEALPDSPTGWDAVIDAIVARAADHRVVIINESHMVTRHRETTRRLLAKLRPLGFRVLAAEAFSQMTGGTPPVEQLPAAAWPRMIDGYYATEPVFGRLIREARMQGYRLAAYEEIYDPASPAASDPAARVVQRETQQARHLAEIERRMAPDERLIVHAGYSHGSEVALNYEGQDIDWMGARFKALTGIDPLTITQTSCRSTGGNAFLAVPPGQLRPGQFDMVVSHPVDTFAARRTNWRREAGDVPTAIPASLRSTDEPLLIEAFAWDEPFEAVPVDRVFVEPGEDPPLLLPPGRYRVRAVRLGAANEKGSGQ